MILKNISGSKVLIEIAAKVFSSAIITSCLRNAIDNNISMANIFGFIPFAVVSSVFPYLDPEEVIACSNARI